MRTSNDIYVPRYMVKTDDRRTNKYVLDGPYLSDADGVGNCKVLKSLNVESTTFKVGETLRIGEEVYRRVGKITQLAPGQSVFYLQSYAPTKIEPFGLAMIGDGFMKDIMANKRDLATVFLGHHDYIALEEQKLLFMYRDSITSRYENFMQILDKHPQYVGEYFPDDLHTIKVFDVPIKHIKSYNLIMEGKWSKLPQSFKKSVINFNNFETTDKGLCYQRLYLSPILRDRIETDMNVELPKDAELFGQPIYEEEMYFDNMKTTSKINNDE